MTVSLRERKSVPLSGAAEVFGDISWRGLVFAGICFALLAAYIALPKSDRPSWGGALLPALTSLLFFGLALWRRVRVGAVRWLMVRDRQGLYVDLGYSEGFALSSTESDVCFLSHESVRAVRIVRETLRLPHRFGATRHHLASMDLVLHACVPEEVAVLIEGHQRRFRESGKTGPFPVRMVAPTVLRLCWSGISPGETQAVERLGQDIPLTPHYRVPYPEWDALNAEQQACYLEVLWDMGMTEQAEFLARMYHGLSLKKASALLAEEARVRRSRRS